ncbi:MAG: MarR family winged helix-turn-helix transcriptional regulator [Actinomycetota bacterium]
MSTMRYGDGVEDTEPRWLDDQEFRAWLGYRRMRLALDAAINRDMARDSGLSEPDYDVLSNLSSTAGHRWRMSDLGKRMLWSKSRLSHHISRMEQRGLVRREGVDGDGRGASVVLTRRGLAAIVAAAPHHVGSVRDRFIDLLTREEIRVLGDIAEKVLARLGSSLEGPR